MKTFTNTGKDGSKRISRPNVASWQARSFAAEPIETACRDTVRDVPTRA